MGVPSRAAYGRIGGNVTAALYDPYIYTMAARRAFNDGFMNGHACKVCPEILIPPDLPREERVRRGEALRRAHFARIALRRGKRR